MITQNVLHVLFRSNYSVHAMHGGDRDFGKGKVSKRRLAQVCLKSLSESCGFAMCDNKSLDRITFDVFQDTDDKNIRNDAGGILLRDGFLSDVKFHRVFPDRSAVSGCRRFTPAYCSAENMIRYAFDNYKDDPVLICEDDYLFNEDAICRLMELFNKFPNDKIAVNIFEDILPEDGHNPSANVVLKTEHTLFVAQKHCTMTFAVSKGSMLDEICRKFHGCIDGERDSINPLIFCKAGHTGVRMVPPGAYHSHPGMVPDDARKRLESECGNTEEEFTGKERLLERCVVTSVRKEFLVPWVRSYFSSGSTVPILLISNPSYTEADKKFAISACDSVGGLFVDGTEIWSSALRTDRARALEHGIKNPGWYTKKHIFVYVAKTYAPKMWAWFDDDIQFIKDVDSCFDWVEDKPGFIAADFYNHGNNGPRHPTELSWNKIFWGSCVFFHDNPNGHLKKMDRQFDVEDDESIMTGLYNTDSDFHDGLFDFGHENKWCAILRNGTQWWNGIMPSEQTRFVHYTGRSKHLFLEKAASFKKAFFEKETM